MTSCPIRAPHGGRLDLRSRPAPNKGFALARGPQWANDNYNFSVNYNVNYNGDGEV